MNSVQYGSTTALIQAARSGQYRCVEFLIESGANVNIRDPRAVPSLVSAARAGNVTRSRKTVEILIKAGADVNATYSDKTGATTPLAEVAKRGTPRILNMLIEAGADVNFGREYNFPLFAAVCHGKVESIKLLIQKGADVNKRNCVGNTALHRTLIPHCHKTFDVLMKSGADVNVVNNVGMTPLMVAVQFYPDTQDCYKVGMSRCVENICRLLKAGAQIGRRDHLGRNSLQLSIEEDQVKVKNVQKLLHAAGETTDGPTVPVEDRRNGNVIHINIPEYFTELKENLDLKHLCREAIRKHLINLDPHEHLFGRIPKLGLPSLVTEYLLYDCSLNVKRESCGDEEEIYD